MQYRYDGALDLAGLAAPENAFEAILLEPGSMEFASDDANVTAVLARAANTQLDGSVPVTLRVDSIDTYYGYLETRFYAQNAELYATQIRTGEVPSALIYETDGDVPVALLTDGDVVKLVDGGGVPLRFAVADVLGAGEGE